MAWIWSVRKAMVWVLCGLVAAQAAAGTALAALPGGGAFVHGEGEIAYAPDGSALTVKQETDRAVIRWDTFSIGADREVAFEQTRQQVVLNRVVGGSPSEIFGRLRADGHVFLINPQGVVIGGGAEVSVGSLVASTLDIEDEAFLDGRYEFAGDGGRVSHAGRIEVKEGGYVALLGGEVHSEGVIEAPLGSVALAAGDEVSLAITGDGRMQVQIERGRLGALVEQHGVIEADGGTIILTTEALGEALDSVVNQTGILRARTVEGRAGTIVLVADKESGTADVGGRLDAGAPEGGDGGFIETSGAWVRVREDAEVTTRAALGKTGRWLIDPRDFRIEAGTGPNTGSGIGAATLASSLKTSDVEIETQGSGSEPGDIIVNAPVSWADTTLTLRAHRNIEINAGLSVTGSGGLTLEYGQGGRAIANTARYIVNAPVHLAPEAHFRTKLGHDGSTVEYTVITDVDALQAISEDLSGHYVLGNDIDAGATAGWNCDERTCLGFEPIGDVSNSNYFRGVLDGLGHVIEGLTIHRPNGLYVGLFGNTFNAAIRNVGLVDAAIIGNRFVGSLVGYAFHTEVRRTYATGDVEGISNVGGLFGIVGGSVYDSYAMGTVMGAERVGGLAGASDADILRSFSSATVLGGGAPTDEIVGGLVGYQIGGTIRQSYAVGPVGDAGQILGGLVGYQAGGSITQSYATGPVRGDNIAGGLVGYQSYGSISDSYWNTETTGQDSAAGFQSDLVTVTHVQGLSTAEMLEAANFSGFDFRTVWANAGNQTTPFLRGLAGNQVFNANDLPEDVIGESNLPALYTVIQDAEQLQAVQKDLAGRYVLGNDIDARVTAHWNCDDDVCAGFAPLGDGYGYFTGVFDGLGHVIQGLTIHRPNGLYVGLFGNTFNAAISNLGIVDADITGDRHVGGLAGFLGNGIIRASYVTGSVTGDVEVGGLVGTLGGSIRGSHAAAMVAGDDRVGGLVGASYASISGSYATGSVTGGSQVGGLVGYQGSASISTSYATGAVRGDGDVGGLVGVSSHSTIEHSYWNTETTGQGSEAGSHFGSVTVTHVQGLSTTEMLEAANYAGFDFSTVWANAGNRTTPYLRGVGGNQVFIGDDLPAGAIDVTKRPALYTVIQNAMQLQAMQRDPAGRYVLGNDIDARATAEWNCDAEATCAGFAPIGTSSPIQSNPFSGVFDGLGYVIQGLTIHRPDADYVGLFGLTQDATLRRVGLVGGSVTGGWYVGSLVGSQGGGSIEQSYATGSVSGVSNVGGLVGWSRGSILRSYATGSVSGDTAVGGLAGSSHGTVVESYATGTVRGEENYAGGLLGVLIGGDLSHSFAAGPVKGNNSVGGLVGALDNNGSIHATYAAGAVEGKDTNVGGLVGIQHNGEISASYVTGAVDGIGTYVGGLVGIQRGGSISDSYWNWETTGQITPGRGIVWGVAFLSTAEMLDRANFAAFDFETVWDNAGDQTTPFLRGLAGNQVFNGNDLPEGAINTTNRPALYTVIQDVEQLQAVQKDLAGRYLLGYDIDAGATAHWNCDAMGVCAGFEPIGDDGHRFTGVLDGLGHGIAGLVIERPDEEYVGLFGATQDAALRNVGLAGAAIRGRSYVGGLVGHQNGGVVERSYVSGTVAGEESYVGGLVGYQNGGSIREVYATGSVRGDREVGGLVGRQDLGSIAQSYAAGAVSGNSALGGLVGSQVGGGSNISASFFAITDRDGNVVNDGGDPTGAYTGNSYGTAKTWAELTGLSTFTAAGWDVDDEGGTGKTWRLYEGHATPLLRVFLTPLTVTVKDDKATYDGNHQTGSGEYTVEEAFDPARLLGSAVNTGGGINAGTYALGLTGLYSDQQGYDLVVHEGELTIERRVVHLRGSRVYDGTRDLAAEVFTLDNLVEGETLSLSGTGQMNDKGVGAGKEVTLGSLVLGDGEGGLASNYTLVGGDHRVDIAKATITAVTGIAAVDKEYDGTTSVALDVSGAVFAGMVAGDVLAVASAEGAFTDKNAGINKDVVISGITLGGADAANYELASGTSTTTAAITRRTITAVTGIAAVDKEYDGTTLATLDVSGALFSGMVAGDALEVASATGAFINKNAGENKDVMISGITLGGVDAVNYELASDTAMATATIKRRVVHLRGSRVYDGTTSLASDIFALENLVEGETLALSGIGQMDDKRAGDGKEVTLASLALANGEDGLAENYTLVGGEHRVDIAKATITAVTGIAAADKEYDGTTSATLDVSDVAFAGMLAGDALEVASAAGAFATKDAGENKTVLISGIALGGADAGNYQLADDTALATASIAPAKVRLVGVVASDKFYDGTNTAQIASFGRLEGVVAGDQVAVDWIGAEARFDSPDPGAAKEVVVRGLALTGADAGNYVLAGSLTTQAAIRRPEPPPSVTPGLDAPTPRAPSSEAPLADPSFPDGEIEPVTVPWVDEGAQPAPPPEETLPEEPMREEATGEEGPGGAAPGRATVFLRTADGTFAKAGQTDDVERFGLGSGESIVEDALNETPVAEIMSVVRPDDDAPAVILIVSVLPDGIVVVRVLGPMPPGIDEDAIVAAALRAVEVLEIDPSEVKAVVLQVE